MCQTIPLIIVWYAWKQAISLVFTFTSILLNALSCTSILLFELKDCHHHEGRPHCLAAACQADSP